MSLKDYEPRIAKSALHRREEHVKQVFRDQVAEAAGLLEVVLSAIVLMALLLSVVASLCACGASGVAGGSLLLIPLACNMFGISNDIAMQVVAVGFIIGVLQDSCETALNSSTDVLFTAAACQAEDDRLANSALRN